MTNTKAQVGDLIRIVNAGEDELYDNGDIFEVTRCSDLHDNVYGVNPKFDEALYIAKSEFVIHSKAGEEDSPKFKRDGFRELQLQMAGHTPEEAVAITMQEAVNSPQHYMDKAEEIRGQGVPTTQADHIRKAGAELSDLLVRKNHDYGDSFAQQYAKYGLMSALIRMDDKMRRLETLLHSEEQAQVSESLSDTLLDLAGYALLAYVETQKKYRKIDEK